MFGWKDLFGKGEKKTTARSRAEPTFEPEFPNARPAGAGIISIGTGDEASDTPALRIARLLLDEYSDNSVVYAETLLSAVGALAGFAAQQAIWEGVVRPGRLPAEKAFVLVKTADGESYYFGDLLNTILASTKQGEMSIWRLVAGAAVGNGATALPELGPLFSACAANVGGARFGVPAWATDGTLHELPRDALRHWPAVRSILEEAGKPPLHWPLEIALSAQRLIEITKARVPPDRAALIVMEAAIPMSKIDPRSVVGAAVAQCA